MLVVKLSGLDRRRVCMDRRWKLFAVPCHDHLLELQPGRQHEAVVANFKEVERVIAISHR